MAISPYVAAVREKVGNDLLLLPSVSVLPVDRDGRVLLVRQIDDGAWATIGGTVEPDETPEDAARREAQEEAGVTVELRRLLVALGGPEYRVSYANGDAVAYVAIVYEAAVVDGLPAPDGDETSDARWFGPSEIVALDVNPLNRHLLAAALPLLRDGEVDAN